MLLSNIILSIQRLLNADASSSVSLLTLYALEIFMQYNSDNSGNDNNGHMGR